MRAIAGENVGQMIEVAARKYVAFKAGSSLEQKGLRRTGVNPTPWANQSAIRRVYQPSLLYRYLVSFL